MASNIGKDFEERFKSSVPEYCMLQRLNDPPQSFTKRTDTRFSIKNPCDYLMFDEKSRTLFCLELKTTKYKSISFEDIKNKEEQNRMIHKHQIEGLTKFSEYNGIIAGFIYNFRDEKNDMERTYFQNIKDFNRMVITLGKHSFNEIDILLNGAVKINGEKKRTRYTWNIDELIKKLTKVWR